LQRLHGRFRRDNRAAAFNGTDFVLGVAVGAVHNGNIGDGVADVLAGGYIPVADYLAGFVVVLAFKPVCAVDGYILHGVAGNVNIIICGVCAFHANIADDTAAFVLAGNRCINYGAVLNVMNIGVTYKAAGVLAAGNGAVLYGNIFDISADSRTGKNTEGAVVGAYILQDRSGGVP